MLGLLIKCHSLGIPIISSPSRIPSATFLRRVFCDLTCGACVGSCPGLGTRMLLPSISACLSIQRQPRDLPGCVHVDDFIFQGETSRSVSSSRPPTDSTHSLLRCPLNACHRLSAFCLSTLWGLALRSCFFFLPSPGRLRGSAKGLFPGIDSSGQASSAHFSSPPLPNPRIPSRCHSAKEPGNTKSPIPFAQQPVNCRRNCMQSGFSA